MASLGLDRVGVETLRGVGPQLAIKLKKLGLYSLQDLLFHLPLRYIDRTQITPIGGYNHSLRSLLRVKYVLAT